MALADAHSGHSRGEAPPNLELGSNTHPSRIASTNAESTNATWPPFPATGT
jgi:hypothetical protein